MGVCCQTETDRQGSEVNTMSENTFENFLINKHSYQYEGLDDEMPDDYEKWLIDLDIYKVIEYAEEWGKTLTGGKHE